MLFLNFIKNKNMVILQRNFLAGCFVWSLIVIFFLSFKVFTQDEKTIIVPVQLKEAVWVKNVHASVEYLNRMAESFVFYFLNVNQYSIEYNQEVILRHIDTANQSEILRIFKESAKIYKKYDLATSFHPKEITIDDSNLTAIVTGKYIAHSGGKKIIEEERKYLFHFIINSGTLLVSSFNKLDQNGNIENPKRIDIGLYTKEVDND